MFSNCLFKVPIRSPSSANNQRSYYDGHHCEHNVGFLEFVDNKGITRLVHGAARGSHNDINIWYQSDYSKDVNKYFGDYKVLFDGIYEYVDGPFLCPIRRPASRTDVMYNILQRDDRSIVENKFGRTKVCWPLVGVQYNLKLSMVGIVYRVCVLLTNILIKHQHPLRK